MTRLLHTLARARRFVSAKRSRKALVLVVAAAALSLTLVIQHHAGAQQSGGAAAARTEVEAEAYRLYTEEQLIGARTKAEEALEQNPDSLIGHYVLGCVLREAEGSLARAMYHLGRARELYETTWVASSRPDGAPWELHRDILYQVQGLAGEMELYEYQLELQGYHDYLYDPDLLPEHAWPLMGLGRYDEARDFAVRATKARRDPWMRSAGLNALCAVEGEAGLRNEWLEACLAALDNARERRGTEDEGALTVHAFNAAQAARSTLDFDQAEALALEGARRLEFTPANPWRLLAQQYLDQNRMTDAAGALREMQRWRRRQPAYLRDQDRAETDVVFATVMLVAGETEVALRAVDRAIDQPDRRGLTSSDAEQAQGAHALLRRAVVRTQIERDSERAAFGGLLSHVAGAPGRWADSFALTRDEERIRSSLADDRRLLHTFRMYVNGGLEPLPPWLIGDLIEVVGPGVAAVGVRLARAVEGAGGGAGSPLEGYYDAMDAEIALVRGDEDEAYAYATRALESMPASESLLRARLSVIASEAARMSGRNTDRVAYLEEALAVDGGVIRRMGLSIPARITVSGSSSLASEVGEMIERSPRFEDDPGFEVRVTDEGAQVRACLLSAQGAQIRCATVDPAELERQFEEAMATWEEEQAALAEAAEPEEGEEAPEPRDPPEPIDPAEHLATEFHDVIFGASVSLSSADMSSLDGRTTTGADVAREQMRDLLQGAMDPPP